VDLPAYFDNVRHHILLEKVALRVNDPEVMALLRMMLKATGKRGISQGGVMTPRTQKVTLSLLGLLVTSGVGIILDFVSHKVVLI